MSHSLFWKDNQNSTRNRPRDHSRLGKWREQPKSKTSLAQCGSLQTCWPRDSNSLAQSTRRWWWPAVHGADSWNRLSLTLRHWSVWSKERISGLSSPRWVVCHRISYLIYAILLWDHFEPHFSIICKLKSISCTPKSTGCRCSPICFCRLVLMKCSVLAAEI